MNKVLARLEFLNASFREEIASAYAECVCVTNINAWYRRLDELSVAIQSGTGTFRQIEDHVFELKIMRYLKMLSDDAEFVYEPPGIDPNGRNCDLSVIRGERRFLIEIKSFHPEPKSREIPRKYVAQNNILCMDERTYHNYRATRGHLMDVTKQTEEKFANYHPGSKTALAVPDGFYLHREDLRDFVFLYRRGRPRDDDPLGPMTVHNLRRGFRGSVDEFWAFPFEQLSFHLEGARLPSVIGPLKRDDRVIKV